MFKEGDIVYKLCNPEIVPEGYEVLDIVYDKKEKILVAASRSCSLRYHVGPWKSELKKSIKELGTIITEDDIKCPCCERP